MSSNNSRNFFCRIKIIELAFAGISLGYFGYFKYKKNNKVVVFIFPKSSIDGDHFWKFICIGMESFFRNPILFFG
jgi:hypothetical protein